VYAIIKRALKLCYAINLFFLYYLYSSKGYNILQDVITLRNLADLEQFFNVLKLFKDLTKRIEGRANKAGLEGAHGSLYETPESLDILFKKLQEAGKFADDHLLRHPLQREQLHSSV
jgi:hypothetical protein